MGSLSSQLKVKAPKAQVVYYTPVPGSSSPPLSNDTPTPEETSNEQRAGNLLMRARGNFGTILTGFRGLLAPAAA